MKSLLVADDDSQIVESIKEMLVPYYEVDISTTGIEILKMLGSKDYFGFITDIDFGPGISGLEIATMVRSKDKHIRILIFSAIDYSDAVRQQVVDIGAVFAEKPLNLDLVRRVMKE